jgi:hypothetical protein
MTQRVHDAESAQAKNTSLPGLLPLLQTNAHQASKPTCAANQPPDTTPFALRQTFTEV